VDQAYWHYIAHIGKPPGPMLDDYAARVSEGAVWVIEEGDVIAAMHCGQFLPIKYRDDNVD
jgi:hypothetical protein